MKRITNWQKIFISVFFLGLATIGFMVRLPGVFRHYDRQMHAAFYFLAAAFFTLLVARKNFGLFVMVLMLLAAFGIGIEHAQEYSNRFFRQRIHGRYDPEDVKYNLIGLLSFAAIWVLYLVLAFFTRAKSRCG